MHKIPTIILALFVLASNFIAVPILAASTSQISVSATVLEHITTVTNDGSWDVTTNSSYDITKQTMNWHGKSYETVSLAF